MLIVPARNRISPPPDRGASAQGHLQNPLKINFYNRRRKDVQDGRQGSQNEHKFMKNRALGPLDLFSDVLLSIFDFERQYNDFHGFSISGGSLEDNKSTEIDSDNHIETMYRQNPVQSTIHIRK